MQKAVTTFLLIRHGENDWIGRGVIAGRTPGVHLNAAGRQQAGHLAEALAKMKIDKLFSSPIDRARDTAEPVAARLGLAIEILPPIQEVNFGDWTGKSISELDKLEGWKKWNTMRSIGQIPNGENMMQVQSRFVGEIERLRHLYPNETLALFSHGDPIRAAVTYYLGMPLDLLLRIEVGYASITEVTIDDWHIRFETINYCPWKSLGQR